jgi:hypothetical protein
MIRLKVTGVLKVTGMEDMMGRAMAAPNPSSGGPSACTNAFGAYQHC